MIYLHSIKIKRLFIRSIIIGIAVVFLSVSISLFFGEYIVKHLMPQETYQLARMVGLHIFADSDIIPFTFQKNVKDFLHISYTREFTHHVSTNSHGTRGPDFSDDKKDNTYRILFLGDSMTFGWGVEDNENFPYYIQRDLAMATTKGKYGAVETINAGFTDGLSLDAFYLYYKDIAAKFKPDLVVVGFLPYNDISDIYNNNWEKVDGNGYPLKIVSKTDKVENGYLMARKKYNWKYEIPVLRNMHLGILFFNAMERGSPALVDRIKKFQGITTEREAFNIVERLRCVYSMQKKECPDVLWPYVEKTKFIMKGIQNEAKKNNQDLLFLIIPTPDQVIPLSEKEDRLKILPSQEPQKYFREFFDSEGIKYIDLLPALSIGNSQRFYYKQDGHFRKEGHQMVAQEIAKYLGNEKSDIFLKLKN